MAKKKSALRKSASLTQEEAVEVFQTWWEANWLKLAALLAGVVLVMAVWYGWTLTARSNMQEAAVTYFNVTQMGTEYYRDQEELEEPEIVEDLIATAATPDTVTQSVTREEYLQVLNEAVDTLSQHPESPYYVAVLMERAKFYLLEGQLENGLEDLREVNLESAQEGYKLLAFHRILRTLIQQKKYEEVIESMLEYEFPQRINTFFNEILGDAYLGMGNYAEARNAYKAALELGIRTSPFLRYKLQRAGGVGFTQTWEQDGDTP